MPDMDAARHTSNRRGHLFVLIAVGLIAAGAGAARWAARHSGNAARSWAAGETLQLPAQIAAEEVVANLLGGFDGAHVEAQVPEHPVRIGRLQPGSKFRFQKSDRRAIVAPPPSRVTFRTMAPAGAALRFGIGVERDRKARGRAHSVQFAVIVDGKRLFTHVLDPVGTRADRRWVDARVDMGLTGAGPVEIALETRAVGVGERLPGTVGWSNVRVVRETPRDRQPSSPASPSVLVLLVDTLRADRLGCYGNHPSPSPTLDHLAREGLRFEEVISQSSWTLPSVTSILTGLHPRSHGVVGSKFTRNTGANEEAERLRASDPSYLPDAVQTLAERAQAVGLTTIGVSTNPLVSRGTNLARGFETFVELGKSRGSGRPTAAEVNGLFLEWLRANAGRRFLGYLHYMDVHVPYRPAEVFRLEAPPDVREAVLRGDVDRAQARDGRPLTKAELGHLLALYDAVIRSWDAELARLLHGLEAAGVAGSTVVVVTSDHGEGFLEHGILKHGVNLYEELIRVPLVFHGPGIAPRTVSAPAQGIDLLPTLANVLGLEAPVGLPGRDLLGGHPATAAISETRWGFGPAGATTDLVSMRTGHWKLIYSAVAGEFELYDLAADPGERVNRIGSAPEAESLRAQLRGWEETAPAPPPSSSLAGDPELHEKLQALGYVD